MILPTQLGVFFIAIVTLRLVDGLGVDIVFRAVADPEEDGLQRSVVIERHPDNILEPICHINA